MLDEHPTKPVNILLVEDDDVDAEGALRAFKKKKIANPILRAKDGVEALEMLRGENGHAEIQRPYMILTDINMPRMNGIELLDQIRADKDLKPSVVFVLTTSQREEDKVKAYEFNIAGYLIKSNVGEDFMEMVDMLDSYWKIVEFPVS